jgi:RNA-directed DNA polymerase
MSVYVGIDVHRKRSQVAVIDEGGEVLASRNVPNGVEPILRVIGGLPAGTPAAYEAAFGWGWLLELKFFDSVPWDLMVKAVEANITTSQKWVLLYVRRWLAVPLRLPEGTLAVRDRGTAQGPAVSPVLANLFMHYAFDLFLAREFPGVEFERYADDAVVHCASEREAREVLAALARRMEEAGLRLHPAKTKIVYCKDANRRGLYEHTSFTFPGYTFRPRGARRAGGKMFTGFQPAVSPEAMNRMGGQVRQWRIHTRTRHDLNELAALVNPVVAGWMNY